MNDNLGLGLPPGAPHYRAYVGPPEDYDFVSAMTFSLLTALGLRQQHRLLDIGCGSLRLGRLFIPYLNAGHYAGVEPNAWLVQDGIANEVGESLVALKQPQFYFTAAPDDLPAQQFDFALAQSIFSHTGLDLLDDWLSRTQRALNASGALVATFLTSATDATESGWIYPDCVRFTPATLAALAEKNGLKMQLLDWHHPRQQWALFYKSGFDTSWFAGKPLGWNTFAQRARG